MKRYVHLLSGCTYLLFFLLLLKWIAFGALSHYVAPRMSYFVYGCDALFLLMSLFQFYRLFSFSPSSPSCACHTHSTSHRKTVYLHGILFIPLILGFAFPEKTLDSAVAEKRIIAAGRPAEQHPKTADAAKVGEPEPLPSAKPAAVPTAQAQQADIPPATATPSPAPATVGASPVSKTEQSRKAKAVTQQAAPNKAEPPKSKPAAPKKEPSPSALATTATTPVPTKKTPASGTRAVQTPSPSAQPAADPSSSDPADDNDQNDIEKFNQKEIALMQMRMGIGADSSTAADSTATENEGAEAEKIVLTNDNFATMMGEIFADPAAYTGNELEMTGFVLHNKDLPADEAFIVRYVITCCIADATPTYAIAKGDGLKSLKDDTWVTVAGTLADNSSPKWGFAPFMNLSSIGKAQAPKDPYAYY